MDLVEKLIKEVSDDKEDAVKKYEVNFMSGLKVRLKAGGSYDPPQREVGAQHNLKSKMTKGYKNCCCHSHCVLSEHRKTVGPLDLNVELSKEFMFPDLLDRAWDEFEDYKVEMFDALPMVQDKLLYVLHAINTDLDQDGPDAEEDQVSYFASANTSVAMSST